MNNFKLKKTGSQPAKIDAARLEAFNKAAKDNLSVIQIEGLPTELKHAGSGYCGQSLIALVYNNPLITTHKIHEILGVSNAHDISKKLSKRLAKAGYKFEKLPRYGTKKPYCWQLREVDHE